MCDMCDAGIGDDPDRRAEYFRELDARIRRVVDAGGWLVQSVEAGPGTPAMSYTVGLTEFGHPELVVFGLGPRGSAALLHPLGDAVRSGVDLRSARISLSDAPLRVFDVPNSADLLLVANGYYGRPPWDPVPALQVVYPDRYGTWPWEPGCQLAPGSQPMPGTVSA